jgi:hypothetical protein
MSHRCLILCSIEDFYYFSLSTYPCMESLPREAHDESLSPCQVHFQAKLRHEDALRHLQQISWNGLV